MKLPGEWAKLAIWSGVGASLLLCSAPVKAQSTNVTGEYECTEAELLGSRRPASRLLFR